MSKGKSPPRLGRPPLPPDEVRANQNVIDAYLGVAH